jgi:hypothetical protein
VWRPEVIRERFDWGREAAIHAMALRIHALREAVELPMIPAYGGCRSWVELEHDVDVSGAVPVLSESEFAIQLARFEGVLGRAIDPV